MLAETRAILDGEFDDYLGEFRNAIEQREKEITRLALGELKFGDTVRFSAQINPKYLIGRTAEVVKVNPKSIVVNCPDDPGYGRFQGSRRVRCPKYLIEGLA